MTNNKVSSEGHHITAGTMKRSCTDIIFLILFVIFCCGLVGIAIISSMNGDLRRLIYPTDSEGKLCGINNGKGKNYQDRPYLMFYDFYVCVKLADAVFKSGCPTRQVCVEKCPTTNEVINVTNYKSFVQRKFCTNVGILESFSSIMKNGKCPLYIIPTKTLLKRCVPQVLLGSVPSAKSIQMYGQAITSGNISNISKNVGFFRSLQSTTILSLSDIYTARIDILLFCLISIFIGILTIVLLRFFVRSMTYIAMLGIVVSFGVGAYFFIARYNSLKKAGNAGWPSRMTLDLKSYGDYYKLDLLIGCILLVLFLITVIVILGVYKNIRIATQLLIETSKAVAYVWGVYIYQIINIVLIVFVTAVCIIIAGLIETSGEGKYVNASTRANGSLISAIPCSPNNATTLGNICKFVKYGEIQSQNWLYAYVLFMWFWLTQFIDGLNTSVIAGSFAGYYWALDRPKDIPKLPTVTGVKVAMRYHLGSIAFGSLLIAIFKYIRLILEYFCKKTENYDNAVMKRVKQAMRCCFWCLGKILNFITENAFVYMMIHGGNFCSSTRKVFALLIKNVVSKSVTHVLAKMVVFMFCIFSTSITGFISYLWFIEKYDILFGQHHDYNYAIVPLIFVVVIALLVNRSLFEIYNSGVNTIFICFIEDLDVNDGSPAKPYHMSNKLLKIILKENKNKPVNDDEEK